MIFDMKSLFLYGLMAVAHASPVSLQNDNTRSGLEKRAKITDFVCPDGTTLSENDIKTAFKECKTHDDGTVAGSYPKYFGNKAGKDQQVLTNVPAGTDLREFPIVEGGVYTGGTPGAYRVVTDYKGHGNFRGVIQHTGSTVGGAYTACTPASNSKRGVDGNDKKKGKDGKDKKNNHAEERRAASATLSTSTSAVPEVTQDTSTLNDLAVRAKNKKVGSATCSDGVILSKDDVNNAYKRCKNYDDYGMAGYPHEFKNGGGVFPSVTKSLREFPIIQGGVWAGGNGKVAGKYRVVTDYNDKFVGVMIEGAGASFTKCTVNDD